MWPTSGDPSRTDFLSYPGTETGSLIHHTDRFAYVTRHRRAPAGQLLLVFGWTVPPACGFASTWPGGPCAEQGGGPRSSYLPGRPVLQRDRAAPSDLVVLQRSPSQVVGVPPAVRPPHSNAAVPSGSIMFLKPCPRGPHPGLSIADLSLSEIQGDHSRGPPCRSPGPAGRRRRGVRSAHPSQGAGPGGRPRCRPLTPRATWLILPVAYACLKD